MLTTFQGTQPSQTALRERVLWAMSLVADPRFRAAYVAGLAETEGPAVRQAAVRGIATLKDPQLADDLRTLASEASVAAGNLREISEKVADGQNTVGRLLESDEAYVKLDTSLDDLNSFTTALREGEGTVGKLVMEDDAYEKVDFMIDSVQGIVDAFREQSPVITFAVIAITGRAAKRSISRIARVAS